MTPRKRNCLTTVSQVNLGEIPCYPKLYNMGLQRKRGLGVMIVPCDCAIFGVHVIYKIWSGDRHGFPENHRISRLLYMPMISFIHPKCPIAIPFGNQTSLAGDFPAMFDYWLYIVPMISPIPFHYIPTIYTTIFDGSNHHFWNSKTILCRSNHIFLMVQSC